MATEDGVRGGLRERKKQETRIALSWAAIRLAVERGFDKVRVEDIAAEVGVSTRTFNNYFSSKAEAIATRHLDRVQLITVELRSRPAAEPLWDALVNAVLAQLTLGQESSGQNALDEHRVAGIRLMLTEPAVRAELIRLSTAAEAELATAIAERTGTDAGRDLYPQLVAATVGAAIRTATLWWLYSDQPGPIAPLLREALDQLAAGLPVP